MNKYRRDLADAIAKKALAEKEIIEVRERYEEAQMYVKEMAAARYEMTYEEKLKEELIEAVRDKADAQRELAEFSLRVKAATKKLEEAQNERVV